VQQQLGKVVVGAVTESIHLSSSSSPALLLHRVVFRLQMLLLLLRWKCMMRGVDLERNVIRDLIFLQHSRFSADSPQLIFISFPKN
jgi:hypothetical protein